MRTETSAGSEWRAAPAAERDDGMLLEGVDGTIDPNAVAAGVESVVASILDCFAVRYEVVEVLSGDLTLGFRIARDGGVLDARLLRSTVGDRETERCIVKAARRIRFAAPSGGEADASHSLTIDLPDDVRPPVEWPVARAQSFISANGGASLKLRCGAEAAEVVATAYVARGGRVLAAGASGDVPATALDCVSRGVSEWRFSDPGSYPAKVSLTF